MTNLSRRVPYLQEWSSPLPRSGGGHLKTASTLDPKRNPRECLGIKLVKIWLSPVQIGLFRCEKESVGLPVSAFFFARHLSPREMEMHF